MKITIKRDNKKAGSVNDWKALSDYFDEPSNSENVKVKGYEIKIEKDETD